MWPIMGCIFKTASISCIEFFLEKEQDLLRKNPFKHGTPCHGCSGKQKAKVGSNKQGTQYGLNPLVRHITSSQFSCLTMPVAMKERKL